MGDIIQIAKGPAGLTLAELEDALARLESPVKGRLDLRLARLAITALRPVVELLRREQGATACVANNSFSPEAFFKELEGLKAMDLFETDRLTLGWTDSEVQLSHLAAKATAKGRVLQLTDAITAVNSNVQKVVLRDPSDQLRQLKAYKDTDDRLIEEAVSYAVAGQLEGGAVVFANSYEYQGELGDLDGLVVGKWQGQDVVVLLEAKHNMDSSFSMAKKELFNGLKYWESLAKLDSPDDLEDAEREDWEAMHVGEYRERKVMLAWGGCKFSDHTVQQHFKIREPWFRVVPDMKGKFAASYMGAE